MSLGGQLEPGQRGSPTLGIFYDSVSQDLGITSPPKDGGHNWYASTHERP